jgi:VanZ family protein
MTAGSGHGFRTASFRHMPDLYDDQQPEIFTLIKTLLATYLSALAFLSLNPWLRPSAGTVAGFVAWDKIDHAIAYGGLTILLIMAFGKTLRGYLLLLLAILVSSAIGILAEYCQAWLTETRQFSSFDVYANGFGAVLGAAGFGLFRFAKKLIRPPREKART